MYIKDRKTTFKLDRNVLSQGQGYSAQFVLRKYSHDRYRGELLKQIFDHLNDVLFQKPVLTGHKSFKKFFDSECTETIYCRQAVVNITKYVYLLYNIYKKQRKTKKNIKEPSITNCNMLFKNTCRFKNPCCLC